MQVAPVNHRYCGWRESTKLVPQTKAAVSDFSDLNSRLDVANQVYDRDVPGLITDLVSGVSTLQSARMLIYFIKEQFKESA